MEKLVSVQAQILEPISNSFHRFLYQKIDWKNRLIGIKGPRGAGKTTLLLQYLKFNLSKKQAIYASADHPYFYTHSLYELAESFHQLGGRVLLIDEVHKYPNWSRELKSIHDSFPKLSIIFSSSSALDIFKGEADLSRRVAIYELPGMSFREFLSFKYQIDINPYSIDEVLQDHQEIATHITSLTPPLALFKEYITAGYLPFAALHNTEEYHRRLNNVLNTVLESDLATINEYSASNTLKIKRLLGTLAETVPYEPNISQLARKLSLGRNTVLQYLSHLQQARLLNFLHSAKKGMTSLRKPDKIFLENTNLSYALKERPDIGSIRETFAMNQFLNSGMSVSKPLHGDFLVDNHWTFEVGGRSKSDKQIRNIEKAYILADDIEIGFGNKIPLWIMGFLY